MLDLCIYSKDPYYLGFHENFSNGKGPHVKNVHKALVAMVTFFAEKKKDKNQRKNDKRTIRLTGSFFSKSNIKLRGFLYV